MAFQALLGVLGAEIESPEEESFLLFSQSIPSQNLGFVDSKATLLELTIGDRDFAIHQSPTILSSNRGGGTTGAVVWKITPLFASWVATPTNFLFKSEVLNSNSVVLELGCGISGLIGMSLSALVKSYVLTDQDYVMRILNQNITENRQDNSGSAGKSRKSTTKPKRGHSSAIITRKVDNVIARSLDWETDEVTIELAQGSEKESFDAVIACDCIYNDALIQPLVQTCIDACKLRSSGQPSGQESTICIVAQQLRSAEIFALDNNPDTHQFSIREHRDLNCFSCVIETPPPDKDFSALGTNSNGEQFPILVFSIDFPFNPKSVRPTIPIPSLIQPLRDSRTDIMSGVGNFVNNRNTPLSDRAALAAGLKISDKTKRNSNSKRINSRRTATPTNISYASNGTSANRNSFPSAQFQPNVQRQQPENEEGMFDDTMTSGFDRTRSDLETLNGYEQHTQLKQEQFENHYPQRQGYDYAGDGDSDPAGFADDGMTTYKDINMPPQPHELHHKQSQQPLRNDQQDFLRKQTDISGRFHPNAQPNVLSNLELRQIPGPTHEEDFIAEKRRESKKRHRSHPESQVESDNPRRHHEELREELPNHEDLENGVIPKGQMQEDIQMDEEHQIETPSANESPRRQSQAKFRSSQVDPRFFPDYTNEQLKSMTYADLKNESWDTIPGRGPIELPEKLRGPQVTMEQKIDFYSKTEDPVRSEFFEGLSTEEWEYAGDVIVEKMASLMQAIKASGKKKRRIMEEYEAKYEAREKAVRGKSESYDAKLKQMKHSGEGVLRRKKV
ncbi:hypothetical protein G7Y89_g10704 [Cudoniella acicularis]|uniref:Extracellular mutant protein 11 C-terminal domain-containing protein n=1 Tax=Cudoniella acicularis TaxID=354080 RepID=A0A8H4W1C2_9HELO|nr:hypothetical protein G7Y89_g10704 [Cudoniella acicularis]